MVKIHHKYKILLDENMPPRLAFPLLNHHFNVKHIDHDFKKSGVSDREVYHIAVAEKRIIITRNIKHFIPLAGIKEDVGIIGIAPHWQPDQIDKKLVAFIKRINPKVLAGKYETLK